MSRLQRIAAELVEFYQQTDAHEREVAELLDKCQTLADKLSNQLAAEHKLRAERHAADLPQIEASVGQLAELLQGAVTTMGATANQVRISGSLARAWAEQAVTDTATGKRVPSPGLHDRVLAAHPDQLPPAQVQEDLDDAIQEQIDHAKGENKKAWKRLFETFPSRPEDEPLGKARWYAENAVRNDLPKGAANFLRGMWFNKAVAAVADQFRATEVYINNVDLKGKLIRQFRVDALGVDEVVSLKNTQLWRDDAAAKRHIDELREKYRPGQADLVIADTKGTKRKVARGELGADEVGRPLDGDMILGVPPQSQRWSDDVAEYAREKGVEIRVYEPHPDAGGPV